MFSSLSLPKFSVTTFSPPQRTRLYLVKALPPVCALSLLLLPLPSWAGQWAVTYSSTGTYSYDSVGPGGTMPAHNGPVNTQTGGWNYSPAGYVDAQTTASVTATLTWQPNQGNSTADPPPPSSQPVFIKEVAVAEEVPGSWYGPGPAPSPAGTASDSLGDAPQAWGRGYLCTGTHLLQKDGSSGVITLDAVSLSAVCPQTHLVNGNPDWLWTDSVNVNLSVSIDSRGVNISCPTVDASQYRDPPLTGPVIVNKRQPDESLRGDTVLYNLIYSNPAAGNSQSFSYHANVAGNWSGTYHWFSSLTGSSSSGSFPSVPDFSVPVTYQTGKSSPSSNAGAIDHIFISMYDGTDGAEATANYYMHFHDKYEPSSWPLDAGYPCKVMGTDPEMPSWPSYPWQVATDQNGSGVPPLVGPQGSNAAISFGGSVTQGGHVDGGLGVGKGDVNAQFGGGYDWSKSSDYSVSINPTPALGQNQQTWAVCRPSVNRSKGHLDIYGVHGYTQTGIWYKDNIVTTDYNYYQPYQPTNVTPFVPAAGWNPPGYN